MKRKTNRRRRRIVSTEPLESRQLLTANIYPPGSVNLSPDGEMFVNGTDDPDMIEVDLYVNAVTRQVLVQATVRDPVGNIILQDEFPSYEVEYIYVYGFGDRDTLVNETGMPSTLVGGDDVDHLYGSRQVDYLLGGHGADYLYGGDGDDFLYGGSHDDFVYGQDGEDTIYGDSGIDFLYGGADSDSIYGGDEKDHIYGQGGDDFLFGEAHPDYISGGPGNDVIYGDELGVLTTAGRDVIYGGSGNDIIIGAGQADTISGGTGADIIYGNEGGDVIDGGIGADRILGGDHDDTISGGEGDDELWGESGEDVISGGNGNDRLMGGDHDDELNGDGFDDVLFGEAGNDTLSGGTGDDRLYGGTDDDKLDGGDGHDGLLGGEGANDLLTGGTGADRFLTWRDEVMTDYSSDDAEIEILDTTGSRQFTAADWQEDEIVKVDLGLHLLVKRTGNNTLLRKSNGGNVRIKRYSEARSEKFTGFASNNDLRIQMLDKSFIDPDDNLPRDETEVAYIVLHEIAHYWDESGENAVIDDFRALSGWTKNERDISPDPASPSGDENWFYRTDTPFLTEYAKENPLEDWAETFAINVMLNAGYRLDTGEWSRVSGGGITMSDITDSFEKLDALDRFFASI